MEELFEKAAQAVTSYSSAGHQLTDAQGLQLYGLFKQKKFGDVNTSRPGIFNQKDRAKWDAWEAQKGKPQEQAASEYVDAARQILPPEFASQIN